MAGVTGPESSPVAVAAMPAMAADVAVSLDVTAPNRLVVARRPGRDLETLRYSQLQIVEWRAPTGRHRDTIDGERRYSTDVGPGVVTLNMR